MLLFWCLSSVPFLAKASFSLTPTNEQCRELESSCKQLHKPS